MVSPVTPVPDTDQNSDRVFSISGFLVKSLTNKNCPNSKTSNNIDMKLGPVTNLVKKIQQRQKNLTMTSCWQMMTSLSLFQIYGQFGVIRKPNFEIHGLYF